MSGGKLLVTKYKNAVVSMLTGPDGKTVQVNVQTEGIRSLVGNIYAANVKDVVPSLGGAFVEAGGKMTGFLRIKQSTAPVFLNTSRNKGTLRQGDRILVQVAADAVKMKDPVLTDKISLAGKYAVLIYPGCGIRFSSKIRDEDFRNEVLLKLSGAEAADHGFIIRTASFGVDIELIRRDMDRLEALLLSILSSAKTAKTGTIYENRPVYLTDTLEFVNDYDEIITDDGDCYKELKDFLEENYPEDLEKIRFFGQKAQMKTIYGLSARMDEALNKTVRLKSGGFLVIEPTEALVVIDVNSGSAPRPDFLKINLEGAKEIARQIRLRNMSGIIIVDFISMKDKEKTDLLISETKKYLTSDPAKPVVCDMTELGLLEITRKKTRRPLYEFTDIC